MKSSIIIILIAISLFVLFNGCSDNYGYNSSFIENKTDHLLHFRYYSKGQEATIDGLISIVSPGEFKEVSSGSIEAGGGVYPEDLIYGIDSLVIMYDNAKSAIHYDYGMQKPAGAGIGFEASRNFFNLKNWNKNVLKDTKKKRETEYIYTFTEQDYSDAK